MSKHTWLTKGFRYIVVAAEEETPPEVGYIDAKLNEFEPTRRERQIGLTMVGIYAALLTAQANERKLTLTVYALVACLVLMLGVFYAKA